MERGAKLVTFVSMVIAVVVQSWFVSDGWPTVWPLTIAVFVITACVASVAPERAAGPVLLFSYIFPAVIILMYGRFYTEYGVVWMAAVLGVMAPGIGRSRWAVPLPWRAPLILWALTVALSWPIVVLREFDFAWTTLDEPRLASSIGGGFPHLMSIAVANTAATIGIGILWFDWLFLTFGSDVDRFRRGIAGPLASSWLVAVAVSGYQLFGDLQFLSTGVFFSMGRATSTMGDANAFGMVAAVAGALVIAWLLGGTGRRHWWLVALVIVLSWVGVWASGSRTAFAAGVAILLSLVLSARSASQSSVFSPARVFLIVGTVVLLLTVAASMRLPAVGPLGRLRDSLPSPTVMSVSTFVKEMWNRNNYGAAATVMIRQHPLVGVGVGGYYILVPDYSSLVGSPFIIPRDNAQNWYRHQLAEFGLLGSIGWIVWTLTFSRFLLANTASVRDRLSVGVLKGAIVALACVSLVGMPTQNTAVALTLWTLAFWVFSLAGSGTAAASHGVLSRGTWAGVVVVLCLFIAGTAYAARHELRVAQRAARADWHYSYGFYDTERGADGREFRWARQRAAIVLPATTPWLRVTVAVNHSDVAGKPVDVRIRSDGDEVLRATLRSSDPRTEYVRLPDRKDRFVLDTWVSRVVRPRDYGGADPRDLGLIVSWEFVDAPPIGLNSDSR